MFGRNSRISSATMEFSTGSAIRGVNNYIYDGLVNKRIINRWNASISSDHSFLLQINYENLMILVFVDTPGADPTEESEAVKTSNPAAITNDSAGTFIQVITSPAAGSNKELSIVFSTY